VLTQLYRKKKKNIVIKKMDGTPQTNLDGLPQNDSNLRLVIPNDKVQDETQNEDSNVEPELSLDELVSQDFVSYVRRCGSFPEQGKTGDRVNFMAKFTTDVASKSKKYTISDNPSKYNVAAKKAYDMAADCFQEKSESSSEVKSELILSSTVSSKRLNLSWMIPSGSLSLVTVGVFFLGIGGFAVSRGNSSGPGSTTSQQEVTIVPKTTSNFPLLKTLVRTPISELEPNFSNFGSQQEISYVAPLPFQSKQIKNPLVIEYSVFPLVINSGTSSYQIQDYNPIIIPKLPDNESLSRKLLSKPTTGTIDMINGNDLQRGALEYEILNDGNSVRFSMDSQSGVLDLEKISSMFGSHELTNSSTCGFYMNLDSILAVSNLTVKGEVAKYCLGNKD
jgi:hypothetical protein